MGPRARSAAGWTAFLESRSSWVVIEPPSMENLRGIRAGKTAGREVAGVVRVAVLEGRITWTNIDDTVRADAWFHGLEPGVVYGFRYRATTKNGLGDWCEPVCLLVK